jgi:hypothetical protein
MRRSEDPCRDPASEMRDDHFKPDALDAPRLTTALGLPEDSFTKFVEQQHLTTHVSREAYDQCMDLALQLYERANLRDWDRDAALHRFFNLPSANRAVKEIACHLLEARRELDEAREAFSAQTEEWHEVKKQRDKLEACLAHLRNRDWFTDDTIHREVICGLDADMVREALNSLKTP